MKELIVVMFLFSILVCSCGDIYEDFTEDEQDLFAYDEGDQISLYKETSGDTIVLEVVSKEKTYNEHKPYLSMRFGSHFLPFCTTILESEKYHVSITFHYFEDYSLNSCIEFSHDGNTIFYGAAEGLEKDSVSDIDKFYYLDCDLPLGNQCDSLLYSKSDGILYLKSSIDSETYTLIN